MNQAESPIPWVPLSERNTIDIDADELSRDDRPPWWRWVIDRNPMFLLSGVFMLAGCFLVSRHIHELDPAEVGDGVVLWLLLALLAVLNVYEFAVIGLGLWLSRTQTLVRDTRHLLGLALLLLVDAAFVYNELGVFDPGVGAAIAGIATGLACVKAWLILKYLGLTVSVRGAIVTAATLGAMYAMPVIVRAMADDGFLGQPHAMGVWVAVGVLVALHALPGQWVRIDFADSFDRRRLQRLVRVALIGLPIVSVIGHAYALLWVYENDFVPAMVSPLLLGLAAIVIRHREAMGGGQMAAKTATLVVASAIVTGLFPGKGLLVASELYTWVAFSPLRGVLILASVLMGWSWWVSGRKPKAAGNVLLPLCAAAMGHTPGAMIDHGYWLYAQAVEGMPTTKLQWGTTAITAAFACLLLGALLSWLGRIIEQRQNE